MDFRKYIIEWALLTLSLLCIGVSLILDCLSLEATTWFSRSGSIVVLAAAIVEYRLSRFAYEDIYDAAIKTSKKRAAMPNISDNPLVQGLVEANLTSKPKQSKPRIILSRASLTLIVLGTIIWGYGDILLT